MRVGLTYDLRDEYLAAGYGEEETAEFDQPGTIDAIESALRALGHTTDRIGNLRQLVGRLVAGGSWDLVFNIAEGLGGFGREGQVPALLSAFSIPYTFCDPLVAALTLHKGMTKRVLRDLGIPTPDFVVVEDEADIDAITLPWPLFVKPVAEGTAKGIDGSSRVATRADLATRCRHILATYRQPALVESYLPGREFTVGITGTGRAAVAVGTLEILLGPSAEPHSYTYVNKERCEDLCTFRLAEPEVRTTAEKLALAAWRGIGGRDAGRVDLRTGSDGRLYVLEINPLPGLHPTHSDLPLICTAVGLPYVELMGRIVESAASRGAECEGLGRPGDPKRGQPPR
jgi:D-alanine-D-alanine ligase